MKLIASLTSPFARKVRIVLAEKQLEHELVVDIPWNAETQVPQFNPLGKVPVLVINEQEHTSLFDSRVIVEYLERLVPSPVLIPKAAEAYIQTKRQEALADGIADAAATIFIEQKRSQALQSAEWIARQQQKIDLGLQAMSQVLGDKLFFVGEELSLADISSVCCLGYLDLRFAEIAWRSQYPNLANFMTRLADRESIKQTIPMV
ncbi:MAG: glutathione S-transferase [Moraxellaceae bacterium]|nr:glutathione S-transferase [Pseudomonadales bacterium]MCB1673552.1 glutathione S-transferase [Pseudomonadales bacterium]MCP5175564.1 glutathione S-transferase [Moraxellaceae bacterium]